MATMHDYCLTAYDKIGIFLKINIEIKLKIFIYNQFLNLIIESLRQHALLVLWQD